MDREAIAFFARHYPHDFPEPISLAWALKEGLSVGEVPVLMYPDNVNNKPLCDYLRDDWLYKGTGRLRYHDNNLFFDPSRTNVFSWRGEGKVVDRSGRELNYTEEQSFVVDPESFAIHVERVQLRFVPR